MRMALVKLPQRTDYWSTDQFWNQPSISRHMSRNRFMAISGAFHMVDNFAISEEAKKADIYWKVRPALVVLC